MWSTPLTDQTAKAAVWNQDSDAAQTTSIQPEDQIWKIVAVNIHHMDAVQTTPHLLVVTIMMAAAANTHQMDAAPTKSHRLRDPNSKDAHAMPSNSVAAQMVLPFLKDHIITDATARKPNSNAAAMESQQHQDPTMKDAHAPTANMDAAQMAPPKPLDHNMKAAKMFQHRHKKLAVLRRMAELVAITPSNTSSMSNMAVAHASGTAAAVEMKIASNPLTIVKTLAKNQKARLHALCPKSMAHALATTRFTTTTLTATSAHNSSTVDVLETTIGSKLLRLVKNFALLMTHCVSNC